MKVMPLTVIVVLIMITESVHMNGYIFCTLWYRKLWTRWKKIWWPCMYDLNYSNIRDILRHVCISVFVCVCMRVYVSVRVCRCVLLVYVCIYWKYVCANISMDGFFINFVDFHWFPLILFYIIRSIDFAKANSNIALVPRLETVCIPEALAVAVTVIRFVVTIQYSFFLDYSIPFYLILFYFILF